jgi:hypothetical protein
MDRYRGIQIVVLGRGTVVGGGKALSTDDGPLLWAATRRIGTPTDNSKLTTQDAESLQTEC